MRDILANKDPGLRAVVDTIAHVSPDVVLLTGFDWDLGNATLQAFGDRLDQAGAAYPYLFATRPNSGMPSGVDLDGDGRLGDARDAQGFGRFPGNGGMALLSRLPIEIGKARDFSGTRWRDLPGALLPETEAGPFPSEAALAVQRLSSVAHWDVPLRLGDGSLVHLLAFAAGPPVFDGPEDQNGKRNHDEVAFWARYLEGSLDLDPPGGPVVLLGLANLDPVDGEGLHDAIKTLVRGSGLQDVRPASIGGAEAARLQGGVNDGQIGDPAQDTADWRDDVGPGNLRVSYVLPDQRLPVVAAGVFWPALGDPLRPLIDAKGAPRHRLVWVDIDLDR